MRLSWFCLVAVLGGCRFPIHEGFGGDRPRPAGDEVKLLLLPTEDGTDEPETARALDETMVRALTSDPRVHIERAADRMERHAACDYAVAHGMDHVVKLSVMGAVDQAYGCRDSVLDIFSGNHENRHATCGSQGPPYAAAEVQFTVYELRRCRDDNVMSRMFGHQRSVEGNDYHPLLAKRVAEAKSWMEHALPTYFARDVPVSVADDAATLPIGSAAGIRDGDAFEIFDGTTSAGMARAVHVTDNATEVAPAYGGISFAVGQHAVQRGRPWALDVGPMGGVATTHATAGSERAGLIGLQGRVHIFGGSGLVVGAGVTGQLSRNARASLLGPEIGWGLQLVPWIEVHAIAGISLVNTYVTGMDTGVAIGTDGVAGITWSTHHTYVTAEGGYQTTSKASEVDLSGPIARVMFGIAP